MTTPKQFWSRIARNQECNVNASGVVCGSLTSVSTPWPEAYLAELAERGIDIKYRTE
jgi:hypothetical protein